MGRLKGTHAPIIEGEQMDDHTTALADQTLQAFSRMSELERTLQATWRALSSADRAFQSAIIALRLHVN